jgi:hypothetical protein
LTIEFFLRILIFNQKMQKSLDFGPESARPDFDDIIKPFDTSTPVQFHSAP